MFAYDHLLRRFNLRNIGHRVSSMPMLLALIPIILGIILADSYTIPLWLAATSMTVLALVAWRIAHRRGAMAYSFVTLLLFGYLITELRREHIEIPYNRDIDLVIDIDNHPTKRYNRYAVEGEIKRWSDGQMWHDSDYRVQLYTSCDTIGVGDRLHLNTHIKEQISRNKGYNDLLHHRGVIGRIDVNAYEISHVEHGGDISIQAKAIERLGYYVQDSSAHATVEAMAAGSRRLQSTELREAYSRTGLSHLMAVSGLHLGIVLIIINILLIPVLLIHRGYMIRNILSIIAIWVYVVVCGGSPSVVRAAVMISIVYLTYYSSQRYNTANILATAVLLMIVYRPESIYDISFQLSVAAVMGIVLWAVPIIRRLNGEHLASRYLIASVAVGMAASIWTLPIISHTFGNVPIIGIIITPLAMFTAYIIIGASMATLLLPPPLGMPFARIAEWSAGIQNDFVVQASHLEWAIVEYRLGEGGVAMLYAIIIAITVAIWAYESKKSDNFVVA